MAINLNKYFIFNRDPVDELEYNKLTWVLLIIAAVIGSVRDIIIYAISTVQYDYSEFGGKAKLSFKFEDAYLHAFIEFFMLILFYKLLERILITLSRSELNIDREIFFAVQLSIIKDIFLLLFVAVFSLNQKVFPSYDINYEFHSISELYWNLYAIYVLLTIIFLSRGIIRRLKESYRNINSLLVASFFISMIVYGLSWGIIWIVRLLISLPLGREFIW